MELYLLAKVLHIISSTLLFGTGLGIAFFMFRSAATQNLQEKYFAARTTVIADLYFTTPAVIIQPITGLWLVHKVGYPWDAPWLIATYMLYLLAGACWLPVVWIQIHLRNILKHCLDNHVELPPKYTGLFKLWFWLGWPAFGSLVIIFYLMVAKPVNLV